MHRHRFVDQGTSYYKHGSIFDKDPDAGVAKTHVYARCSKCNKTKVREIEGVWCLFDGVLVWQAGTR